MFSLKVHHFSEMYTILKISLKHPGANHITVDVPCISSLSTNGSLLTVHTVNVNNLPSFTPSCPSDSLVTCGTTIRFDWWSTDLSYVKYARRHKTTAICEWIKWTWTESQLNKCVTGWLNCIYLFRECCSLQPVASIVFCLAEWLQITVKFSSWQY